MHFASPRSPVSNPCESLEFYHVPLIILKRSKWLSKLHSDLSFDFHKQKLHYFINSMKSSITLQQDSFKKTLTVIFVSMIAKFPPIVDRWHNFQSSALPHISTRVPTFKDEDPHPLSDFNQRWRHQDHKTR